MKKCSMVRTEGMELPRQDMNQIDKNAATHIIASAAKQSRGYEGSLDCFVAFGSSQ
jgi:hypothetical protein